MLKMIFDNWFEFRLFLEIIPCEYVGMVARKLIKTLSHLD